MVETLRKVERLLSDGRLGVWWCNAKQGGAGVGLHVMAGHRGRTQDNSISLTSVSFDTWDALISARTYFPFV